MGEAMRTRGLGLVALLADRLGPWAPVRAGLSAVPLVVVHCAHCDRYRDEDPNGHPSCLLEPFEATGKREETA